MLVAGAASSQQQLASAANNAVVTITQLADCVKFGATSLGSNQPDAQVRNYVNYPRCHEQEWT